jgi:hypothetical protein
MRQQALIFFLCAKYLATASSVYDATASRVPLANWRRGMEEAPSQNLTFAKHMAANCPTRKRAKEHAEHVVRRPRKTECNHHVLSDVDWPMIRPCEMIRREP